MTLAFEKLPHKDAVLDRAVEILRADRHEALLLVPAFEDKLRYKKELALRNCAFGVRVNSFDAWVDDTWELAGDGRMLVDHVTRSVLCAGILGEAEMGSEQGKLRASAGTVKLLEELVRDYLPLLLDEAAADAAELSSSEQALLRVAHRYAARLRERNLVERSEVASIIAGSTTEQIVVGVGFEPEALTHTQRIVLGEISACLLVNERTQLPAGPRNEELAQLLTRLYRPSAADPVEPSGALCFAFASGSSAENRLIIDQIVALANEDGHRDIVVAAVDSLRLFQDAGPELAQAGMRVSAQGSRRVAETDAGRAVLQLSQAIGQAGAFDPLAATDFLLNELSGKSFAKAFKCDSAWRGDRLLTPRGMCRSLGECANAEWSDALDALVDGDAVGAFNGLIAFMGKRTHLPAGYRLEQVSAFTHMRDFAVAAREEGMDVPRLVEVVGPQMVRIAQELAPAEVVSGASEPAAPGVSEPVVSGVSALASAQPIAHVRFMSLEDAAALEPASIDALLVCGMNSSERPVRGEESAKRTLLDKLGAQLPTDELARLRRVYYDALAAARSKVVLERALNSGDAEPQYPATLFEETIDCYRESLTSNDGFVKSWSITQNLTPYVLRREETEFVYAATGAHQQPVAFVDTIPSTGSISRENQEFIVLRRKERGEGEADDPSVLDLSPSAIENYLECPYLWFVNRRLRLNTPDEGFSPLERGTFVHKVMEEFYQTLQAAGHPRVTPENLSEARRLMDEVFTSVAEIQPAERPGSRYAPANEWEREQVEALRRKLLDYLDYDAVLLPGFVPTEFEWSYGKEEVVKYAGHRIEGTIDRFDVDDQGRVVVIDFKTSLSSSYDLRSKNADPTELVLPRKMQTLIYAQVVRRLTGMRLVAALYINPLTGEVRGAFDGRVLGAQDIPGIREKLSVVPFGSIETFHGLLDRSEEIVAERLEGLVAGNISPHPYGPKVCEYCPATLCEKRQA